MRRALALTLIALAAGGCGAEDDPLAPLREAEAVQDVREDTGRDAVAVTVKPGTGPFAIAEALEAVPRDVRTATFRLGRAELVVTGRDAGLGSAAKALVAVSGVRSPARRIAIEGDGAQRRVRAEVDRADQAAPLAAELVAQAGPEKLRDDAIRTVEVSRRGAGTVARLVLARGAADERTLAALRAVEALEARTPQLTAGPRGAELRVRAEDVADAGRAWAEATDALGDDVTRAGVDVVVDRGGTPILLGRADTSARRALALLRKVEAGGASGFARTDLGSARVRIDEVTTNRRTVARAERAVRAAQAAGARRAVAEWRVRDDLAWSGTVRPADRALTRLDDTPQTVLRLLRSARSAHEAGIAAIQWEHPPSADVAKLAVSEPQLGADGVDPDEALQSTTVESVASSRPFARAIRAVGWPGVAELELRIGPGAASEGCEETATVVRLTSSSTARARSVRPAFGCADEALVRELRATWDATARSR